MKLIIKTRTVDKQYRISLPRDWANIGDEVSFSITSNGNLVVKKIKGKNNKNEQQSKWKILLVETEKRLL